MSSHRSFFFRGGVELLAWFALGGLFLLVQLLPIPDPERTPMDLFLVVLGAYLLVTFHFLFPRTHYAPRLVYLTLIVDVLIVGVLRLLLADYLPNSELAFIPLIVLAALVADWRGVIALALTCALVDGVPQLRLMTLPHVPLSLPAFLNQLVIAATFALTGLIVLFLSETIRRRTLESQQVAERAAQVERTLREGAERAAERWETLNGVGLKMQRESRPEQIYAALARELETLGLNYLIGLWDEPDRTCRLEYLSLPPAVQKLVETETGTALSDIRMDMRHLSRHGEEVFGRQATLYHSCEEMVFALFPQASPGLIKQILRMVGDGPLVIAPLLAGRSVGGFFCTWGADLSPSDLPALTGLGQQIAVALEKARLLEREHKRAAQLALVSEIAERAVGMLDAGELPHKLTDMIVLRFGFENASIFLNDSAQHQVILRAHAGRAINPEEIGYRQSWEIGLIGLTAQSGTTVVSNDVRADPRYHSTGAGNDVCRAELAVPLKRGSETIGVLDVQSTVPNAFDSTDVLALETLASQMAAAFEKSELFARERKRAAQLAIVSAIAESATATLDADQLLQQVVVLICERLGYHYVAVMLLDDRTGDLVLRAASGGYTGVFPTDYRQKMTVGLIGEAARTGTTIVSNDVTQDAHFFFPSGQAPVARSEMCVPLRIGERRLGVFDVHSLAVNAFDASDIAAMETLANQIAIGLENARLYSQTRDEADVKAALLRELSHRVKNNLTGIVGLLYLGLDDNSLPHEQILNETLTRVQSMAVAHTLLANSPHARVDVLELSQRVVGDSVRQMTLPGQAVPVGVTGEAVEISAQQASSLALVLNELATNAIKHGAPTGKELELVIRREGKEIRIEFYSRGGPQLAESEGDSPSGGLGLQLVRTLVEKDLNGSLEVRPLTRGVVTIICFEPEA